MGLPVDACQCSLYCLITGSENCNAVSVELNKDPAMSKNVDPI